MVLLTLLASSSRYLPRVLVHLEIWNSYSSRNGTTIRVFMTVAVRNGCRKVIKIGHEVCLSSASVTLHRIVIRVFSIPDSSSPLSFSSRWLARSDFTITKRAACVHLSSYPSHVRIIKPLGGHTIYRDFGCKVLYWFLVTRLISRSHSVCGWNSDIPSHLTRNEQRERLILDE